MKWIGMVRVSVAPAIRSTYGIKSLTTVLNLALTVTAVWTLLTPQLGQSQIVEYPLYTFQGGADGASPYGDMVRDANDNLYGAATFGGALGWGVVFKVDQSSNETVLHSFIGASDGGRPIGGLIVDASGNLYGTTSQGGASGNGTVFRLSPSRTETVLYNFTGGTDGGSPQASVTPDASGNIYGTTVGGGKFGNGVVFKLDPTGTETVLHSFAGYPSDGAKPYARVVLDASGNLYGTTARGGSGDCTTGAFVKVKVGCGTVFKIDPTGHEALLYSFSGGTDGSIPFAGVTLRNDSLYGTTFIGGAYGNGTVFQLAEAKNGHWSEHVLHSFLSGSDGQLPKAGVIFDGNGNMYGTTSAGGTFGGECPNEGCGFVFELTPTSRGWEEHLLYGFTGGRDGGTPYAGVISDTTGHLFGTTIYGGNANCQCGVVFKLTL